jgi:hypothetical protein
MDRVIKAPRRSGERAANFSGLIGSIEQLTPSAGIREGWSIGIMEKTGGQRSLIPLFHYSIIPYLKNMLGLFYL